ncbi:MAG: hypothetical protein WDM88_09545 [Galbitalea sp.]
MIGRAFDLVLRVLFAPAVLGNLLLRALLFPTPPPPALRHPRIERIGRIANALGVALVVWATAAADLSGREPLRGALVGALTDAVAGLAVIGVLIVCTAILFVAVARPGSRRRMAVRVLIPVGALAGYLVLVVGSVLLANALVPVGKWVLVNIADGFWRTVLTLLVSVVGLYLLSLFVGALVMGTWYGGTQLFRSADAHPLFPIVVGLGMAAVSVALMSWQLVSRGPDPLTLVVFAFGPASAAVLCVVEGAWLLRSPRSVRFREAYDGRR